MPCGGIYPAKVEAGDGECMHCGKEDPIPTLYCEEWDCFLHVDCVPDFLETDEGLIVLDHGHEIDTGETT